MDDRWSEFEDVREFALTTTWISIHKLVNLLLNWIMGWEAIRRKFGGTNRPVRPCDFVMFSLNHFRRFKIWWSEKFGYSSGVYRLQFRVWIDSEGITIGRFLLFPNSCIRLDFKSGIWSMDENGIQVESVDNNSRLIFSDQRLHDAIAKIDQFRTVVCESPTQTSSLYWETTMRSGTNRLWL